MTNRFDKYAVEFSCSDPHLRRIPLPGKGHILPHLDLCDLICTRGGLAVTLVVTPGNLPLLLLSIRVDLSSPSFETDYIKLPKAENGSEVATEEVMTWFDECPMEQWCMCALGVRRIYGWVCLVESSVRFPWCAREGATVPVGSEEQVKGRAMVRWGGTRFSRPMGMDVDQGSGDGSDGR
ncbi:hypothetical protein HPP92_021672 [Vanilla planifolia]|uniref:Uncharacterized protein n=1 Tax=Vanilla planifolia TaxID=51239 RepID=A0A835PVZ6_VANPL|nr:hypothetical protein HPP92_021672 [Vanilla planifolia]